MELFKHTSQIAFCRINISSTFRMMVFCQILISIARLVKCYAKLLYHFFITFQHLFSEKIKK